MELCNKHVIPKKFVNEYQQFQGRAEAPDILAETDDEDQNQDINYQKKNIIITIEYYYLFHFRF